MANKTVLEAQIDSNVGEVADGMDKLSKETKETTSGIKKLGVGFSTLAKASGIVFLLNKAFEAFQQVLGQNQRVVNIFNTAMEAASLAFNDLFTFIDDNFAVVSGYLKGLFEDPIQSIFELGESIKRFFIDRLSSLGEVLKATAKLMFNVANPKKFAEAMAELGIATKKAGEEISTEFTQITGKVKDYLKGIIDTAKANVELSRAAQILVAQNRIILEQKDREAELQRQIRDDETKTFAQRIEANNKLNTILDEQEKLMTANIQKVIDAAQAQFDKTKNDEDEIALLDAKAEKAGILAQIEGFRSEQKTNAIALEKEEKQVALDNINAQLEAYSALAGALSSLAGENKALAVAQAIIDTYAAANGALAAGKGTPLAMLQAAAIIVQGLANVKKIMAVDVGTGGGGSVPSPGTETPAPEFVGGAFTLDNSRARQEPVQAFVVTDDMTNSQDKLALIRRRATI